MLLLMNKQITIIIANELIAGMKQVPKTCETKRGKSFGFAT